MLCPAALLGIRHTLVARSVSPFVPKVMCSLFAYDLTALSCYQQQWKKASTCLASSWQVNVITETLIKKKSFGGLK